MPTRSHRPPALWRVLAPLLLLVPLIIGMWCIDHPPLSEADRVLRAALENATSVTFQGVSEGGWQMTGVMGHRIKITDKAHFQEFADTLRCSNGWIIRGPHSEVDVHIVINTVDPRTHRHGQIGFDYRALDVPGDTLTWDATRHEKYQTWAPVRARFAPRVRALIKRWGQEGAAINSPPGIVIVP